jgi:hypothetical protein
MATKMNKYQQVSTKPETKLERKQEQETKRFIHASTTFSTHEASIDGVIIDTVVGTCDNESYLTISCGSWENSSIAGGSGALINLSF